MTGSGDRGNVKGSGHREVGDMVKGIRGEMVWSEIKSRWQIWGLGGYVKDLGDWVTVTWSGDGE